MAEPYSTARNIEFSFVVVVSAEGVSTRRVRAPRRELIGINSTMGLPPVGGPRKTPISTKHSDF